MVPRFFLAVSFVKISHYFHGFKDHFSFETQLLTIRGMGNPMLAVCAQMFLARSITLYDDVDGGQAKSIFDELLQIVNSLSQDKPRTYEKITFEDYLSLFQPALDWIIFILIKSNNDTFIFGLMKKFTTSHTESYRLIFQAFLDHISKDSTQNNTKYLLEKCKSLETPEILRSLGKAFLRCGGQFPDKDEIINTCWSILSNYVHMDEYLPTAAVWMEFVAAQFQDKEVNKLLGVIIKKLHASKNLTYDTNNDLKDTLFNIVKRRSLKIMKVLSLPNFLSMFTMITKEDVKVGLAKSILEELQKEDIAPSTDSIIHDILTSICDVLADSVTALTSKDEMRQVR